MQSIKYVLLFLLVFFSISYGYADERAVYINNNKIYTLEDKWCFIPDDKIDYSLFDSIKPQCVSQFPQFSWKDNPKFSNYNGLAWYRLNLFIGDNIHDLALLITFHFCGSQFYINGHKIYESRKFIKSSEFENIPGKPDIVIIPNEFIKNNGQNILAIRTGILDEKSGFDDPVKIGPIKLIRELFIKKVIWYSSLAAINIFLMMYFLFLYFYRRDKYYLDFSLLSFFLGLWTLGYHGLFFYIIDYKFIYVITPYISSICVCIFFINFIHSFINIKKNYISRFLVFILILLILFISIEFATTSHHAFFNKYIFDYYMLLVLIVAIYGDVICIINVIKKKPYALKVFTGTMAITISYVISIFAFLGIFKIYVPIPEGFFIMTIIFASSLASRFAQVHTDLEKAHSDLLVLDKMKDDFMATTTHELRTPLHGIIGIAESLADGSLGDVNARQKENLDLITSSASQLNELVTSILDFSKLRAGKADLYIDELSLGDIINSAVSLMKPAVRDKNIEFMTKIDGIPRIKADRNRILQVMLNLLGNAVKFTDHGSITVRAWAVDGGRVRVSVIDTGIGIREEDLARIWSPFTQAEVAEVRTAGGTGLGLAITRHLVELHGGTIWVESEKGKGSMFTFELPLEPPVAGIARRAPEKELPAGYYSPLSASQQDAVEFNITVNPSVAKATILAVDDDPVSLKILENLCASCGHLLITTSTGPGALDIIQRRDVDLVLLDLMLPGMSGFEVCEKMRQSERGRTIPIIMITALDQAGHMVRGFRTGANDYITKPFKRHELILRIENQLVIKQMLDMEKSVIKGLRKDKDAITNLFQRSSDIKESAIEMREWEKIIQGDLLIASAFQQRLMTHQKKITGFETSVFYSPLLEIGGDIYDIFELRPGVVRVFIADATDHGINASLGTVKILSVYAAIKDTMGSPAEIINHLNRCFTQSDGQYSIVFTCVVADIDLSSSVITISSAGAPAQFIIRGKEVVVVYQKNPIIGLSDKIDYSQGTHPFRRGDTLFLYTDGLADLMTAQAADADENELFAETLASIYPGMGLDEAAKKLVNRFGGVKKKAVDDVMIVAVRRTG